MSTERRLHQRVQTDLPGELELLDQTYDVRVTNLSLGGLLVEGQSELAQLGAPLGRAALEVNLHFGLADQPLHCHCRVVCKRRYSHDRMALGLHILALSTQGEVAIAQYIKEVHQITENRT